MKNTFVLTSLIVLGFACVSLSCKEETIVSTSSGDRGSLVDPNIQPRVISTYPPANGAGPFHVYDPGDGSSNPHFVLVFNKLVSRTLLREEGKVIVQGGGRPIQVSTSSLTGSIYSDIVSFVLYDSLSGNRLLYGIGVDYTVRIDSSVRDINGNSLAQVFSFSFKPETEFRVIGVSPASHETQVSTQPNIQVVFNSPLDTSVVRAISISPQPDGYSYLDDLFEFHFQVSGGVLSLQTTYTITVQSTARDIAGRQLAAPFVSSFTTQGFQVAYTSPYNDESWVAPWSGLLVRFSGMIDTSTVRQSFSITPNIEGFLGGIGTDIRFGPLNDFHGNTVYTVSISNDIRGADGSLLPEPYSFSFYTAPFAIEQMYPRNLETEVPRTSSISMTFNESIDTLSVPIAFSITPNISGSFRFTFERSFRFVPSDSLAPHQMYSVVVSQAMRSTNGDLYVETQPLWFVTGN